MDLLVEDRPDLPDVTHSPRLDPLPHPERCGHLLLLPRASTVAPTMASTRDSTLPAHTVVLDLEEKIVL